MKIKHLLIVIFLFTCTNAHAEWFLRGTQNGWGNTQMTIGGTNTMQLTNVVFTSAGSIKFDRFGDWKENYGVGGKNGTNIPVAAGTWNIKFFTDTKNWKITAVSSSSSIVASSIKSSSSSVKLSSSVVSSIKSSVASSSSIKSSSSSVASSIQSSIVSSSSTTGAEFYASQCAICHGSNGKNGVIPIDQNSFSDLTALSNFIGNHIPAFSFIVCSADCPSKVAQYIFNDFNSSSKSSSSTTSSFASSSWISSSASSVGTSSFASSLSMSSTPNNLVEFSRPISITLDEQHNRALVLDEGLNAVIAVDLSNGVRTVLSDIDTPNSLNGFSGPSTITLDPIRNRALVVDFSLGAIIAVDLTDGSRTVLSDSNVPNANNQLFGPDGITLDIPNNRALVADWALLSVIAVDLTSGARTIVGGENHLLLNPTDIVLDAAHNRALVVSNADNLIAVDLTTGISTVLTSFLPMAASPVGVALDTANNQVFVTCQILSSPFNPISREIFRIDLSNGAILGQSSIKLMGPGVGIVLDATHNRILVVDNGLKAVVSVDLTTSERTVLSANNPIPPIDFSSSSSSIASSIKSSNSSTKSSHSVQASVVSSSKGLVTTPVSSIKSNSSSTNSSQIASSSPVIFLPSSASSRSSLIFSSSTSSSSSSNTVYHLRGTQTNPRFIEGDLFSPVAGSTTNFEICRNLTAGTTTSPARFKVDPNGGWGDSFPATDFPAKSWTHIVINGPEKKILSVTENMVANCGITSSSISSLSSTISSSSKSSKASSSIAADDFRARTTYFMFVDRFSNGDMSNDKGFNPMGSIAADATDPFHLNAPVSQWRKYWGGDIQGIINKLDYLQALGITAILVTPLADNVNDTGIEGTYHGYQARDFYEVDEHLGDWALVDKLNEEMEKRNMKLVLDITLNYSNNIHMGEFGALFKEGVEILKNFDAGKGEWYHNTGEVGDCGDINPATICHDEWGDLNKVRNKMLFGLADFNHGISSNSKADEYLIGAAKKWMQHGVDAFRIDAIKHVEPSFINRFTSAVRAEAIAEGKAEPYIFGEWYGAGTNDSASMQFLNERRGSELLDFSLRDKIENAIAGNQSMKELNANVELRPLVMNGKDNWQATFLDNHDAQRTSVYLQMTGNTNRGVGKGMSKMEADSRQNMGMALVMTLPGVPIVYYGTEQNTAVLTLAGENNQIGSDPFNREMMPSFDQSTPAFKLISALAKLRSESKAIQSGSYKQIWVNDDILVFQRQQGDDCAVVAVNRGQATSINVQGLCLVDAIYVNKAGGDIVNVASGMGTFSLPHNGINVLH